MISTCAIIITCIVLFILFNTGKISVDEYMTSYYSAIRNRQYWRFITHSFSHYTILHLALNMIALWSVGSSMERALGPVKFFALYLLFSVVTGIVSALYHQNGGGSIGASGAICGFIGISFALVIRFYGFGGILQIIPSLIPMIVMSFFPQIDTSSHVTGIIIGFIMGFLIF